MVPSSRERERERERERPSVRAGGGRRTPPITLPGRRTPLGRAERRRTSRGRGAGSRRGGLRGGGRVGREGEGETERRCAEVVPLSPHLVTLSLDDAHALLHRGESTLQQPVRRVRGPPVPPPGPSDRGHAGAHGGKIRPGRTLCRVPRGRHLALEGGVDRAVGEGRAWCVRRASPGVRLDQNRVEGRKAAEVEVEIGE